MSLSCSCDEWEGDGWSWVSDDDFRKFEGKKRKRCCSCKELINIGADCIRFVRFRMAQDDIELRIYGDGNEIYIAPWFMCESCGEIFLNLESLGYCINLCDRMDDLLAEYHEMTGFKRRAA